MKHAGLTWHETVVNNHLLPRMLPLCTCLCAPMSCLISFCVCTYMFILLSSNELCWCVRTSTKKNHVGTRAALMCWVSLWQLLIGWNLWSVLCSRLTLCIELGGNSVRSLNWMYVCGCFLCKGGCYAELAMCWLILISTWWSDVFHRVSHIQWCLQIQLQGGVGVCSVIWFDEWWAAIVEASRKT